MYIFLDFFFWPKKEIEQKRNYFVVFTMAHQSLNERFNRIVSPIVLQKIFVKDVLLHPQDYRLHCNIHNYLRLIEHH